MLRLYFALLQATLMVFGRSYVCADDRLKQDGYSFDDRNDMW